MTSATTNVTAVYIYKLPEMARSRCFRENFKLFYRKWRGLKQRFQRLIFTASSVFIINEHAIQRNLCVLLKYLLQLIFSIAENRWQCAKDF